VRFIDRGKVGLILELEANQSFEVIFWQTQIAVGSHSIIQGLERIRRLAQRKKALRVDGSAAYLKRSVNELIEIRSDWRSDATWNVLSYTCVFETSAVKLLLLAYLQSLAEG
jgi:hypothetical protein